MFWEHLSEWFIRLSQSGVQFGLAVLLQSTALIGLGLVTGRLVRRKGAATQSVVYRTTLSAVVLCPVAWLLLGAWGLQGFGLKLPGEVSRHENDRGRSLARLDDLPAAERPCFDARHARAASGNRTAVELETDDGTAASASPLVNDGRPTSFVGRTEMVPQGSESAVPQAALRASKQSVTKWVLCLLASAWLIGSCWMLMRLLAAHRGMMRLVASACEVDSGTAARCRAMAARFALRPPLLRQSALVTGPCLVGLVRPVILLPEGETTEGEGDADVLVHELAHLARRDHLWNLLGRAGVAVLFFQPLVWLLVHRMVRAAEDVCDDYVVDCGLDRRGYARRLVDLAEQFQPRPLPAGVGIVSLKSLLGRRIVRILDGSRDHSLRVGFRAVAATGLAGSIATVLVGLATVAERPADAAAVDATQKQPPPARVGAAQEPPAVEVERAAASVEPKLAEPSPPLRAADLAPPVRIVAGGRPIDVDGFASPFVGDFDEDGVNDLLVGQLHDGRLRIYRNRGTNAWPRFDTFEWFTAEGSLARVPSGCAVGFTPQLIDFDGDGRTDILSGSFVEGLIYLFRRKADGTFAEAEMLENKHGEVQMGRVFPWNRALRYNATVFSHDWDEDGDLDLLFGRGSYCLVPNEGTRRRPVFGDALPITVGGKPIPSGRVPPCVADWDGDGRDDLLIGCRQDVVWYRNTAQKGRPVLQPPQILVSMDDRASIEDEPLEQRQRPVYFYSICAADFNGDGRLDLLLGDHYAKPKELSEARIAEMAAVKETRSELLREFQELMRAEPENETRGQRIERRRRATRKCVEYCGLPPYGPQAAQARLERHAGVWLYERVTVGDVKTR